MAFPEAFRELIAAGAETVIIPTYCMYFPPVFGFHHSSSPVRSSMANGFGRGPL